MDYVSDQTPTIVQCIANSAPERETQLHDFLCAYPVRFLEVEDATGIVMNATLERVKYARKDLQVVWLVGFSLWKAIHLFAPAVLGPTLFGHSSGSVIDMDENLPLFERDYRERMASIARVIEDKTLNHAVWPPDIPDARFPRPSVRQPRQGGLRHSHHGDGGYVPPRVAPCQV